MPNSKKPSWAPHWGSSYDINTKLSFIGPILEWLEDEGLLGERTVDVGSGALSVVSSLTRVDPLERFEPENHPIRKVIHIDIAANEIETENALALKYDAEHVIDEKKRETKRAIAKAVKFLDIDCSNNPGTEQIDSMIFSEILNYVDYESVLTNFAKYLKKGGVFFIVNMPKRGMQNYFSEKGVTSNAQLKTFLETLDFEIIKEEYPWASSKEKITDTSMMALVVRKK